MDLISIQTSGGVLLIGRTVQFDPVMLRAGDGLMVGRVITLLRNDRVGIAALRRLYASHAPFALGADEVLAQFRNDLRAGVYTAVLLRECGIDVAPAELAQISSNIVYLALPASARQQAVTLLIAPPGVLPVLMAKHVDNARGAELITGLNPADDAMRMIERQANRIAGGAEVNATGAPLAKALAGRLKAGLLDAAVLEDPQDIWMAAARKEVPLEVAHMSGHQKIAESILRSRRHLGGQTLLAVEAISKPEQLAVVVAIFDAAAEAQGHAFSSADFDTTLVLNAWTSDGMGAVSAIGDLIKAIALAEMGGTEIVLDNAAIVFAQAFEGMGAGVLQALLTTATSKKGGMQETSWKAKLNDVPKVASSERPRDRAAPPPPPPPPARTKPAPAKLPPPPPPPPPPPKPENKAAGVAEAMLKRAQAEEPKLTDDIAGLTKAAKGEMAGLEYRLKTAESLARKIASDMKKGDLTAEEAASRIVDANRYTSILPADKLVEGYEQVMAGLKEKGYQVTKVKNTWDKPAIAYKGVNVQLVSPSGQPVELQFHTPESFWAKDEGTHALYEQQRLCEEGSAKWQELDQKQRDVFNSSPRPEGIEKILPYP